MAVYIYSHHERRPTERGFNVREAFDVLSDTLLEFGPYVLHQLNRPTGEMQETRRRLLASGLMLADESGQIGLGESGARRLRERALRELLGISRPANRSSVSARAAADEILQYDVSKAYQFGDPVAHLDVQSTLRSALARRETPGLPPRLTEADLFVHEVEHSAPCATVILLDRSASMAAAGKFFEAKRAALALFAMIQSAFPGDQLSLVTFATTAEQWNPRDLPGVLPWGVDRFEVGSEFRAPLGRLPRETPRHLTNIQAGLRLARRILHARPGFNRQILCVTDGEPTAHLEGESLVIPNPPGEPTRRATLGEARRCTSAGIAVSAFALFEERGGESLRNFVGELMRQTRGGVVYCTAGSLGRYILDHYARGRRSRRPMR